MKKIILSFITFVILLAVSSCNKDVTDGIIDDTANDVESVLEQAKSRILSMGLDTTDMVEIDGYYVVENDILINKDSLFNALQTRQYHATYTVATGQTITICVNSQDLLNNWRTEISKVADIYTEYTGNVFKFIGCDTDADIVISKADLSYSNVCAEGEFPVNTSGKPGKRVRINSTFYKDIDTFLSDNEKIFLMMHEIGHNLGLRHTNCINEVDPGIGKIKIPGTPDVDNNSYMNSATCGYSWNGMPEYDAVALKYLFPVVYNTIHFENCTGIADIKYKKGTEYELSRTLIPQKDGYVFAGWYYGVGNPYIPAIDYGKKITGDLTLYARWETKGTGTSVDVSCGEGMRSSTFTLSSTKVISLSVQVCKGLNSWYELRCYDDTYVLLENVDGGYSCKLQMKEHMYLDSEPYFNYTPVDMVLEPGTYKLTASLTTALGPQNSVSYGKHASIRAILKYN